jgi:hypothetical protein
MGPLLRVSRQANVTQCLELMQNELGEEGRRLAYPTIRPETKVGANHGSGRVAPGMISPGPDGGK